MAGEEIVEHRVSRGDVVPAGGAARQTLDDVGRQDSIPEALGDFFVEWQQPTVTVEEEVRPT